MQAKDRAVTRGEAVVQAVVAVGPGVRPLASGTGLAAAGRSDIPPGR